MSLPRCPLRDTNDEGSRSSLVHAFHRATRAHTGLKRHAFLIVAHQDLRHLQQLISLLDHDRNDIYLQVDSQGGLRTDTLATKRSSLTVLPPMPVYWGGLSLIQAELNVLRAAFNNGYHYYHLLSGSDLPLVSQECLHARLEESDLEYVDIDPGCESFAHWKVAYYHLLVETRFYRRFWAYRLLGHALVKLQALAGIDRTRKTGLQVLHGSAFFSITHAFAEYVLDREDWVRRNFHHTLIGEEVFMQTLLMSSPFRGKLAGRGPLRSGNLRYIDWSRKSGNSPYTFTMRDYEELKEAGRQYLIARKFNRSVDPEIVETIVARLSTHGAL